MRWLFLLLLTACIEPTEPEFQLEQPFFLVEGQITTLSELSTVTLRRSAFRELELDFEAISGATVVAESGAGAQVPWEEEADTPGRYRAPASFAPLPGERWGLVIILTDGTELSSTPEIIPPATAITDLQLPFAQEAYYDEDRRRTVPAFSVLVDYDDPAGRADRYRWDYRYWERVTVCCSRLDAAFVGGVCIDRAGGSTYDYLCPSDPPCFREVSGDEYTIDEDVLSNGAAVRGRELGKIDFINLGGLLVEAQQYSITPAAYAYGKVVADLLNGSSGLNATIPTALIGNIRNADPTGLEVLGYVGASSVSTRRAYLERTEAIGQPLARDRNIRLPPSQGPFVPPPAPCAGRGLAPVTPEGWPE